MILSAIEMKAFSSYGECICSLQEENWHTYFDCHSSLFVFVSRSLDSASYVQCDIERHFFINRLSEKHIRKQIIQESIT